MSDALILKFENEMSRLELQFTPDEGRTFDSVARIHQGTLDLSFKFCCFGYDLDEFARELLAFHSRYHGVARLATQHGDMEVEFSLIHPAQGVIGIVATFQVGCLAAGCQPKMQEAERRSLVFTGFTIEQSYLPALVAQIRGFLTESGISTIHPMIHKPSA